MKSPNAKLIAELAGSEIVNRFNAEGLVVYRTVVGELVHDGYLEYETLPNGTVLQHKIRVRITTPEQAESEEE